MSLFSWLGSGAMGSLGRIGPAFWDRELAKSLDRLSMLFFKRKFLDAIRSGEKTQTIRLWKHRMMRVGQRSFIPGVGAVRITVVEAVEIDELSDADAAPDGFATADALRAELRAIYGDKLAAGYGAWRIAFEKLDEEPKPPKRPR